LELRWGSGYKYHFLHIEEGSNPVKVVN